MEVVVVAVFAVLLGISGYSQWGPVGVLHGIGGALILCSIQAAGVGITLTAVICDDGGMVTQVRVEMLTADKRLLPVTLPFMSTALGLPMLLIGTAVVMNRVPWLPDRVIDHALPSETVCAANSPNPAATRRP